MSSKSMPCSNKKIAKQNILLKNTSKDTKEKWAIEIVEESHPYYENDETR